MGADQGSLPLTRTGLRQAGLWGPAREHGAPSAWGGRGFSDTDLIASWELLAAVEKAVGPVQLRSASRKVQAVRKYWYA